VQAIDNSGHGDGQRPVDRTAAGAFVTAATEMLGHAGDIHCSFAAKADAIAAIGEFAKEDGDLHVGDGERIVDEALAIFFAGAEALHLFLRDPDPGQRTFAMQVGERGAEQPHLGGGMPKINMARAMRGVRSGEHEFARHGKGVLVGAFEHERARVSHERGVEAGGNVAIDGDARKAGKTENKLGGGHHGGIDPVDVGKIAAAGVMVNVDEETFFQTFEKRAPDAVALQQDDSIVRGDGIGPNDVIGKGKVLVDSRNAIVHDDFGILPHDAQDLATGEGRADAVSIRPRVRGHDEAATRPNFL